MSPLAAVRGKGIWPGKRYRMPTRTAGTCTWPFVYAAIIDRMDQGIAAQNTLILFLSDNGGCHKELYN